MGRTYDVDCPSGLSVTLREFKVSDEDLVSNPRTQRSGRAITDLLEAITVGVNDPGPYQLTRSGEQGTGKLDWSKVIMGDRMTALLKNRIETWGPEFEIRTPCEACRAPVRNWIDLNDLEIKPLPESSKQHVQIGKDSPIEIELPSGPVVGVRLLRGKDERQLQKLAKQKKDIMSSAYLRYITVSVEGVPDNKLLAFFQDMSGSDASYLRAAYQEADCGLEQEIELECDTCGHIWDRNIQFGADFLFPKYRKKT